MTNMTDTKDVSVIDANSDYNTYREYMTDLFSQIYNYRKVDDFLANHFFLEAHNFNYVATRYYTYNNPHDLKYRYVTTKKQYKVFLELFLDKVAIFKEMLDSK